MGVRGCLGPTGRGPQKDVKLFTGVCHYLPEACDELRRLTRPVPLGAASGKVP
ncbi:hypothetical protein WMF11_04100 [Sorangium sp. So ce295]|uniref:hypothetical protein n=1 Tax=Sorangium sp. So ce295 TaxID=3133295 RepID=UPI003F5FEC7C